MNKVKPRPLQVPLRLATDSPEAPPELLTDLRMDTPTGERSLENIHPHPSPSRSLDPRHVVDLARTIAALGLIHPLVVDVEDVVVAGSHRYAALQILATPPPERPALLARLCPKGSAKELEVLSDPAQLLAVAPGVLDFARVPVRVLPLAISKNPDAAWWTEVAENERRRDYKPAEIRALAERLRAQGYTQRKGGSKDEARLLPAIGAIIGRSEKQVRRILNGESGEKLNGTPGTLAEEAQAIMNRLKKIKVRAAAQLSDVEHRAIEKSIAALERLARG